LTYSVHAASTVLAFAHDAVASESPRRNRCFHSSIDKVARPSRRTLAVQLVDRACRSADAFRSTPCDKNVTASAKCPLTDGRHERRAHWSGDTRSGDRFMWACHNEREEDQRESPRESRITLSLGP